MKLFIALWKQFKHFTTEEKRSKISWWKTITTSQELRGKIRNSSRICLSA